MDVESSTHPSMMITTMSNASIRYLLAFNPITTSLSHTTAPLIASILEYIVAAISRNRIEDAEEAVSRSAFFNPLKFIPDKNPMISAPNAPTPAASVGVKNPPQRDCEIKSVN